jgi:hypothetical protein
MYGARIETPKEQRVYLIPKYSKAKKNTKAERRKKKTKEKDERRKKCQTTTCGQKNE